MVRAIKRALLIFGNARAARIRAAASVSRREVEKMIRDGFPARSMWCAAWLHRRASTARHPADARLTKMCPKEALSSSTTSAS